MQGGIGVSRRILPDTVVLLNYVGEVDDEAVFQETILTPCYCVVKDGTKRNPNGKSSANSGKLYIFDAETQAKATDGTPRTFVPYETWKDLDNKSAYWTLSDLGFDYFQKEGCPKLRVTKFSHLVNGSKRMHHFEVDGE